jgi:2-haloacid dehalogenase
MQLTRRDFMARTTFAAAAGLLASSTRSLGAPGRHAPIKAIAFDALAIFDPRPVQALAEQLFPGKGADLTSDWRTRQFEYTWLRSAAGRYADFWRVTQDALVFAAKKAKLEISPQQRERLMNSFIELKAWPDVPAVLASLKKSGYRLALLSNFTPNMLEGCTRSANLEGQFEQLLSTDLVKAYKPEHRAYQLAVDALRLKPEEVLFVAFAGWDAAGAKMFGLPTFWANRLGLPMEELEQVPDRTAPDLESLPAYLGQ